MVTDGSKGGAPNQLVLTGKDSYLRKLSVKGLVKELGKINSFIHSNSNIMRVLFYIYLNINGKKRIKRFDIQI